MSSLRRRRSIVTAFCNILGRLNPYSRAAFHVACVAHLPKRMLRIFRSPFRCPSDWFSTRRRRSRVVALSIISHTLLDDYSESSSKIGDVGRFCPKPFLYTRSLFAPHPTQERPHPARFVGGTAGVFRRRASRPPPCWPVLDVRIVAPQFGIGGTSSGEKEVLSTPAIRFHISASEPQDV